jgi:uncharacterized oxidoreductase
MASDATKPGDVMVLPDRLHQVTAAIFEKDGCSAEEAKLIADHLVLANLTGHDSHGVGMLPRYIEDRLNGVCHRNLHAEIVLDHGAVVTIDGNLGYGQVIAKEAMEIGIERAKKFGVCVVALRNAHHIGRIGHWGEQCAAAGMVSTHYVNVHGHHALVAPFGGAEARFTTNPYCTAIPHKSGAPIVLDFATSQVAMGKVRVAFNKGEQMEPGLLIDAAGAATNDPGAMWGPLPHGSILTFGAHKGGGLAVICDLMAGALTGGLTHTPRTQVHAGDKTPPTIINNMLTVIINPKMLGGADLFEREVDEFIAWVKSSRPQPGVEEVLTPGEPERARKAKRTAEGVPIDATTWRQILDAARRVGLSDNAIAEMAGV